MLFNDNVGFSEMEPSPEALLIGRSPDCITNEDMITEMIALKEFTIKGDFQNAKFLKSLKNHKEGPFMIVMDHITGRVISCNEDLEPFRTLNQSHVDSRSVNSSYGFPSYN